MRHSLWESVLGVRRSVPDLSPPVCPDFTAEGLQAQPSHDRIYYRHTAEVKLVSTPPGIPYVVHERKPGRMSTLRREHPRRTIDHGFSKVRTGSSSTRIVGHPSFAPSRASKNFSWWFQILSRPAHTAATKLQYTGCNSRVLYISMGCSAN